MFSLKRSTLAPVITRRSIDANRRRCLVSETGGTIVEFAIAASLLMLALFGVMDCSLMLYFDHYVRYSADEATRYAMVRGSSWNAVPCSSATTVQCMATSTDIKNYVSGITPLGASSDLSVATTWSGLTAANAACNSTGMSNAPGCLVQVTVSYDFNFILPLLPKNTLLLSSTSAMTIIQ